MCVYITPAMYRIAKIPQAATKGHHLCVCVFFNTSENKTKQKVFPVLLLCGIEIKLVFAPSIKEVGKKSIVHSCFHYSFFTI